MGYTVAARGFTIERIRLSDPDPGVGVVDVVRRKRRWRSSRTDTSTSE